MKQYSDALKEILATGQERPDRTNTGTISKFGVNMRFDLTKGFPAVTTKTLAWKAVVSELIWMLEGSGDEYRLREILHGDRNSEKKTIWTANATSDYWVKQRLQRHPGDLGRIYGVQWRKWRKPLIRINKVVLQNHDQLLDLIAGIKNDPYSRRHIISAWNPGELDMMALPPCHVMSQFYVTPYTQDEMDKAYFNYRKKCSDGEKEYIDSMYEGQAKTAEVLKSVGLPVGKLSCQMYQRSADMFLGVPFNIASYALFTHLLAQVCDLSVGELMITIGDAHIYKNHLEQVKEQLTRKPLLLPTLKLNTNIKTITDFMMIDIELVDYQCHPSIKADMAV
jgi:thymidylate synthase